MRGQKGQASILIAVIFQLLFVFFAMVINVGLLVHDKINLQNSTDIAAYYAAMKQAEVLNTMAELNYQLHQNWKLFNWRLWVLADAGRNADFDPIASEPSPSAPGAWKIDDGIKRPIVCVTNTLWKEVASKPIKNQENLCDKVALKLPALVPPNLTIGQDLFAGVFNLFVSGISAQNARFVDDFAHTGIENYIMASDFVGSFKIAAAERRFAIHKLQNQLISGSNDFTDLTGNPVSATVLVTLKNNLTASNKANGVDFQFQNGLGNNPFMVPIDVRVFVPYLDFNANANSGAQAFVQQLDVKSAEDQNGQYYNESMPFWKNDYNFQGPVESSRESFLNEGETFDTNNSAFNSLIGFEKNPWVLAYVKVTATTHPKMLFSPLTGTSGIALTAESYAMPFGGKMGPWYSTGWQQQDPSSKGAPLEALTSLAPRLSDPPPSVNSTSDAIPNYSRFPGDTAGMSARLARWVGLKELVSLSNPSFADYQNIANLKQDPIVSGPNPTIPPPSRPAEIAGVAPDLFDATYYSVTYDFPTRYQGGAGYVFSSVCDPNSLGYSCLDLGNDLNLFVSQKQATSIKDIFFSAQSTTPGISQRPFWLLTASEHLNTSWSQGDPGEYDATQAGKSVGKTWENPGSDNPSAKPAGGRAGYSVKLVSKHFLTNPNLPLGGTAGPGGILNPPQP
jgi:Putative Flp pilus-assembly TadE/G-like